MKIFPFTLRTNDAKRLFQSYVQKNRAMLDEQYGRRCFTGNAERDSKLIWSYYEVDAEVLTETTVRFTTYGMKDSYYGGRGKQQEVIKATLGPAALRPLVEAEKVRVATGVYHARREAAAAAAEIEAINAVHKELFP